jgi:hypothetical protein
MALYLGLDAYVFPPFSAFGVQSNYSLSAASHIRKETINPYQSRCIADDSGHDDIVLVRFVLGRSKIPKGS